jgi:hypothetical protein
MDSTTNSSLNSKNKIIDYKLRNIKYNEETYNSLSILQKIMIKNSINKIISAYKSYIKRKNVSMEKIIFL